MRNPHFRPNVSINVDVLVPGADPALLRRVRDDLRNRILDVVREHGPIPMEDHSVRVVEPEEPATDEPTAS